MVPYGTSYSWGSHKRNVQVRTIIIAPGDPPKKPGVQPRKVDLEACSELPKKGNFTPRFCFNATAFQKKRTGKENSFVCLFDRSVIPNDALTR
jgi:hypothetical protein